MVQISPNNNHGSIRFRFTILGVTYNFSTGGKFDDPTDLALANAIAALIRLDLKTGNFDQTLDKYTNGSIIPTQKPRKKKITKLLTIWDKWVKSLDLDEETQAGHYRYCRNMILKTKPSPYVDNASWLLKTGDNLSDKSFNHRLGYFRRCLLWAMNEGLAVDNPFNKIKRRKNVVSKTVKPFTADEMKRIVKSFKQLYPDFAPFVMFLFFTGCRTAEAIGIQWKRVDFARGEVTIADSLPITSTGVTKRKGTKTDTVTVLLMNEALRLLIESLPKGKPDDLLFTFEGANIKRYNFRRLWIKVLEHEGIEYRKPYTSRHTFASHGIDQGLSLTDVAYLLGHKDTTMVNKTYGRVINRPKLPTIDL
jgi:integrase